MSRPDVDVPRVRETLGQLGDEAGPAPDFEQVAFGTHASDVLAAARRWRRAARVGVGVGAAACIVLVAILWAQTESGTRVVTAERTEEAVDDPGLATAEGQSSPEAVVAAHYEALSSGDLDLAFGLVSPERREGVTESEWTACMVNRLGADRPGSIYSYEHDRTQTDQSGTYVAGNVAAEADGTVWANRFVVILVNEIDGVWYWVAEISASSPDCLGSPFGNG